MKKLLLFLYIACSVVSNTWSQTLKIDVATSTLFPTTIDSLQPYFNNLNFWVINEDSTLTQPETINIECRVKNSNYSKSVQLTGSKLLNTFGYGDSTQVICTYTPPNDTQFFVGDDIVVIWPTGSGGIAIIGDSITETIHADTATGAVVAPPINNSFNISMYPNPAENLLFLKYNESIINLEQVRIYDLLGRTVLTKTSSFNTIDINYLPNGLYFLEAINNDESRYVIQFTKTP